ncbi:MAG: hypothetical protein GY861_08370 [bacterium]|nr:hypothetical protein [bacterium]
MALNVWIEIDMSGLGAGALRSFFEMEKGTPEWNALSRKQQLIKEAVWQANSELKAAGGERMYRSKLNNMKYLLYVHVPMNIAMEFRGLPHVIDDRIRWASNALKDLPDIVHAEYFTGVMGERVVLSPEEAGYDPDKSYPYFNVFYGVEP